MSYRSREPRFAWVRGHLREVRPCWLWLFERLHIGFEVPSKSIALAEALEAAEIYHRKCQIYLKAWR